MPTEAQGGGIPIMYAYVAIFLIFYFLVIRPQRKQQNAMKEMIANLKKNDRVVTTGGIHGTVSLVKDKTVVVRVDENVRLEITKDAVASVEQSDKISKGEDKGSK